LGVSGAGSPRPCQSTYSTTFYPQKQNLPGVPGPEFVKAANCQNLPVFDRGILAYQGIG
jgi:hypothetical protein